MRTSGRLLLFLSLVWAASWGALAAPSLVEAKEAVHQLQAGSNPAWTHREVSETATEPPLTSPPGQAAARGWNAKRSAGCQVSLNRAVTAPASPSNILLLIQRQNE